MKRKSKQQQGFTLIELLVVISIITLISSITLVSLVNARKNTRDVKRIADMNQIIKALDFYYEGNNSTYPTTASYGESEDSSSAFDCGGWDTSQYDRNGDGLPFISALATTSLISKVLEKVPTDPLNSSPAICGGSYSYRYARYYAGYCNDFCQGKAFYVLGINNFETQTKYKSPGFACHVPGWNNGTGIDITYRDWGGEFTWVYGKCE